MRLSVAILVSVFVSMPAAAVAGGGSGNVFLQCDGYAAPGKKADMLTTTSRLWGLSSSTVDQRRNPTQLGVGGVQACDAALADPLLLPNYAMRRANLLQAKAVHQITSGQFADALASLSQSDAAGQSEALFDQSLGQGNRALRAVALNGLGRKAEANTALDQMGIRRPWAASQQQFAARVRLQFDDDLKNQMAALEKIAPLVPDATQQLFWWSVLYDNWPAALRYAQGVSFDDPKERAGWTGSMDFIEPYIDMVDRAKFAGALSYAQFAAGQKEASVTTMATAKTELEVAMIPLAPRVDGQAYSKKELAAYEQRKSFGTMAMKLLNDWASVINLRADAPNLTIDEIKKRIDSEKLKVPTLSDVIAHAKTPDPVSTQFQQTLLRQLAEAKDARRLKDTKMGFEALVKMLPRPETPSMKIVYRREGNYFFGNELAGYAVKRDYPAGANSVRFASDTGALAAVDEGAIYAAAQLAQADGKDSFLIDSRKPIERTIRYTGMYSGGRTEPSGYEVRLVVRPINAADASADDRRRLVNVGGVYEALMIKMTPPAR